MITSVYFIRHAQSDRSFHDEYTRPLTAEGINDTEKITLALKERGITHILSSPYTRTLQTVQGLSKALALEIETDDGFRERNAGRWHGDKFFDFIRKQWEDFDYRIEGGESLREVQERNVKALNKYLKKYKGHTIAAATHGTALSTIINYFFPEYGYEEFLKIADLMPFVLKMDFDDSRHCIKAEKILSVKKTYK